MLRDVKHVPRPAFHHVLVYMIRGESPSYIRGMLPPNLER